jgi:hypothetical protein
MKRVLQLACFFVSCLSFSVLAEQQPKGLVIYQDLPSSRLEATEFHSIRRDSVVYTTLTAPDGKRKQIKTDGVIATLDYPPYTFDDYFADTAHTALKKIQGVDQKFPGLRNQVGMVRGKWERALSVFNQTYKPNPAPQENQKNLPVLSMKTAQYSHARLISATYDSATIMHDAGVARIPLSDFNVSQIVELNTTSTTTQLGTMAFLDQQVAVSRSSPLVDKIKGGGIRALVFVASRSGIRYESLLTWLLFIIFPALIIALAIANIVQAQRHRRFARQQSRR